MIDLMQELELRTTLAERDREARAALLVNEAGSVPRGLRVTFVRRLARLALRANRGTAREPTVSGS